MIGSEEAAYHFEFTHHHNHSVGRAPSQDNLIVFYLPEQQEWQQAVERMKGFGYEPVAAYNPYWDKRGITFEDPDGYRVVLQRMDWTL